MTHGPVWTLFEEFDTAQPVHEKLPANCFERITLDYLANGYGAEGTIGDARSYLFDSPDLVRFGVHWIERFVSGGKWRVLSSCLS